MSYMPVYITFGLSNLYLFSKAVVCNDEADTFNRFACISLTIQINKYYDYISNMHVQVHTHLHICKASIKFTYGWSNYRYR